MVWPEISIEDFPPERDDEPSSLRQDIIDELTDHFACALNRELLKNPDEQTAKQRVLNQFGDPIKIARQLWLEAMKEKIMSQRILTGVSVIMAVCGFIVVGLVWSMMKQNESLNLKMLEQMASIADRPQPVATSNVDQKILKQLEELNQKQTIQVGSASKGMNQISIQLVQDNKEKTPAVGFTGKLVKSGAKTDSFSLKEVSDAQGILDFGNLPWGKYEFYLNAPWGESFTQSELTVIPGRDYAETIICPKTAPEEVLVQFQVNWTEKLKKEGWFLLCDFRQTSTAGGDIYYFYFNSPRRIGDNTWMTDQDQSSEPRGVYLVSSDNRVSLCPLNQEGRFENIKLDTVIEKPSVNMLQGDYSLPVMYLVQKEDLKQLTQLNSSKGYFVLNKNGAGTFSYNPFNPFQRACGDWSSGLGFGGSFGGSGNDLSKIPTTVLLVPFKNESISPEPVTLLDMFLNNKHVDGMPLPRVLNFSAGKDQANLWKIDLPDLARIEFPENKK